MNNTREDFQSPTTTATEETKVNESLSSLSLFSDDEQTLVSQKKKRRRGQVKKTSRRWKAEHTTSNGYQRTNTANYDFETKERNKFNTFMQQASTTRYWKVLTYLTSFITFLILLASIAFVVYGSCFIRPVVMLDQIQIFRLPMDQAQPVVGFNILLSSYNLNWRPVYLDNCTFFATVSDMAIQVSYEISQPISIFTNTTVVLAQRTETQFEQSLFLNLTTEANVGKLSEAIVNSVLYRASKYIALKFDGVCNTRNRMGWKWPIHVTRIQQYNLKTKSKLLT